MTVEIKRYPAATASLRPNTGEAGWRVIGSGAQACRVVWQDPDAAHVIIETHGAKKPFRILRIDVFSIREDAQKEWRLRKADMRAELREFVSSEWEEKITSSD